MSLYAVQKYLYELNRSAPRQAEHLSDPATAVERFRDTGAVLTDDELAALVEPDIGKLFHLGVNGQILMHFAALHQIEWQDYLQRMRDGIERYGPVREGVYAMTGYEGVETHAAQLGQSGRAGQSERATDGGPT